VARALHDAGVPAVLGSREPVRDDAAKDFAEIFYGRLAMGHAVGRALQAAQTALREKYGDTVAENLTLVGDPAVTLDRPPNPAQDFRLVPHEPPHNLPLVELTRHFTGRGPELVQLARWLAEPGEPAIVLHGIGGIGKSSLAVMAAMRYGAAFQAVVYASAKDAPQEFTPQTLMAALDAVCGSDCLSAATTEKRQQQALDLLNSRRILLVLDNLEELPGRNTRDLAHFLGRIDPRAGSVALLTLRPRHKDPLTELAGAQSLPVRTLDDLGSCRLLQDLLGEARRKLQPREPQPAEKPRLLWLAQHLGYPAALLPLLAALDDLAAAAYRHPRMLELAAAELRRPTASQDAVQQRLRQLKGKSLQEKVQDMVGRMLTTLQQERPDAVTLLQTMLVFRDTCDPEALAAVAGEAAVPDLDDALQAAVDSSLLNAGATDSGPARLWLHPLTAQVLQQNLPADSDTLAARRRRHAEFYLHKARQYRKANMEQWREFDIDWANIAAAADWVAALPLEDEADARLVGDFARALKNVIYWRKLPGEAWLQAGARAFVRLGEQKNEALMYNQLGLIHDARGDLDEALEWYQKSVDITKQIGDKAGLAPTYNNIAAIHYARGDLDEALKCYLKDLEISEQICDKTGLATTYNNIGEVHYARGDLDEALEWYQKSVDIFQQIGDKAALATTYNNIGLIHDARGDLDEAIQWYRKSVDIFQQIGDKAGLAATYNNIGAIHKARGNLDEAIQWYRKSVDIFLQIGDKAGLAATYNNIGAIHKARGNLDEALKWYRKSVDITQQIGDQAGLAVTLHNMGYLAMAKQDWPAALQYFTRSRDLYAEMGLEKDAAEEEELIAEVQEKLRIEN